MRRYFNGMSRSIMRTNDFLLFYYLYEANRKTQVRIRNGKKNLEILRKDDLSRHSSFVSVEKQSTFEFASKPTVETLNHDVYNP